MGEYNNPVKVKCWKKFLKSKNCREKRTKASHHLWNCPNCKRPIVFWGNKKEIPRMHINTNLDTLGIDKDEFNKWLKDNC